ncbi:hypothetical protein COT72_00365, partial [archaeon CG10_big_fil_rev_8_21_14_0_10_43_11]
MNLFSVWGVGVLKLDRAIAVIIRTSAYALSLAFLALFLLFSNFAFLERFFAIGILLCWFASILYIRKAALPRSTQKSFFSYLLVFTFFITYILFGHSTLVLATSAGFTVIGPTKLADTSASGTFEEYQGIAGVYWRCNGYTDDTGDWCAYLDETANANTYMACGPSYAWANPTYVVYDTSLSTTCLDGVYLEGKYTASGYLGDMDVTCSDDGTNFAYMTHRNINCDHDLDVAGPPGTVAAGTAVQSWDPYSCNSYGSDFNFPSSCWDAAGNLRFFVKWNRVGSNCLTPYFSQLAYDPKADGCYGTTYCSSGVAQSDGDASQTICDCVKGAGYWNLGGETSATTCCEDGGENKRTRACDAGSGCTTSSSDDACCSASTDCTYSSTCYNSGVTGNVGGDGTDYCSSGTWYDCNADAHCPTASYCTSNDCSAIATPSITATVVTDKVLNSEIGKTSLSWSGSLPGSYQYRVQYQANSGSWTDLYTGTSTSTTHDSLSDNTYYCYRARIEDTSQAHYGSYSSSSCVNTADRTKNKSPDASLSAQNDSNNRIDINTTNGNANLVLYMPFEEGSGSTTDDWSQSNVQGTITGAAWSSVGQYGSALTFNGADYVTIPSSAFSSLTNEVTLAFWQYGDATIQPQADTLFEARDASSQRVINIHLPWSNENVYWDAGNSGGASYDRINKAATASEYEGVWNHWAFTKNATSGDMKIYLNGELWHSGTGLTRTISTITTAKLGAYSDGSYNYDGLVDEFYVFDKELSQSEVIDVMQSGVKKNAFYRANSSSDQFVPVGGVIDMFTDGDYTSNPAWSISAGSWSVSSEQFTKTNDATCWANALVGDTGLTDYLVEVDLRHDEVSGADVPGIIFRNTGGSNQYRTWIDGSGIDVYDYSQSAYVLSASTPVGFSKDNAWHHWKLFVEGDTFTLYVDGVKQYEVTDASLTSGNAGVTSCNTYMTVDNFKITPLVADDDYPDSDAAESGGPGTPSASVTEQADLSSLVVSWGGVSDTGATYYYTVSAWDDQGNDDDWFYDGSFEKASEQGYWRSGSLVQNGYSFDTTEVYTGGYSLKQTTSASNKYFGSDFTIGTHLDASSTYVMQCMVNTSLSAGYARLHVEQQGSFVSYDQVSGYHEWVPIKTVFTTGASGNIRLLAYTLGTATGDVYWDNCRLYHVESETLLTGLDKYEVDETTANPGATDGYSIATTSYTDSGLSCFNQYTYRVRANDTAGNYGSYSSTASAYPVDYLSCTSGGGSSGYCWTGTSCYSPSNCPTPETTSCSAGTSTCCTASSTIWEGVGCSGSGAAGTSYDRDTTQARCESTASGCSGYTWDSVLTNVANQQCCGDDTTSDNNYGVDTSGSPDVCHYCNAGSAGTSSCYENQGCDLNGQLLTQNTDSACTEGTGCYCYYAEACASSGYTAPSSAALSRSCDYGGYTDGSGVDCLDDSANTCYYLASDPCTSGGLQATSSATCYDPGTVVSGTCYYDGGGSLDRSNDCTTSGCSGIASCALEFGQYCDQTQGCASGLAACENDCAQAGAGTGYLDNDVCFCTGAQGAFSASAVVSTNDTVVYLTFEDGNDSSYFHDSSVYANHGTGSATYTAGKHGLGAYSKPGKITIPNDDSISEAFSGNEITIAFWWKQGVNQESYPWQDTIHQLAGSVPHRVEHGRDGYDGGSYGVDWTYGYWTGLYDDSDTAHAMSRDNIFDADTWYFFVVTKNSSRMEVYINGTYNNGIDGSFTIKQPTTEDLTLLGYSTGNYAIDEVIDDVRIINRYMAPAEIQKIYESTRGTYEAVEPKDTIVLSASVKSSANASLKTSLTTDVAALDEGLVGYWALDEGVGGVAEDASGNGNDGTIFSATWASGYAGNALSFDGSTSYVNIPALDLSAFSAMTISAWIKPDDITSNVYYEIVRQQNAALDWLLAFQNSGTILSFGLNAGASYNELDVSIDADDFVDGQWHLITAVYNGSGKSLYVDNALIGANSDSGTIAFGADTHYIGRYPLGSEYFDGLIDDVKFWNRALSAAEVRQLFEQNNYLSPSVSSPNTVSVQLESNALMCGLDHSVYAVSDEAGANSDHVTRGWAESFSDAREWTAYNNDSAVTVSGGVANITGVQASNTVYLRQEGISVNVTEYPNFTIRFKAPSGHTIGGAFKIGTTWYYNTYNAAGTGDWETRTVNILDAASLSGTSHLLTGIDIADYNDASQSLAIDWVMVHDGHYELSEWNNFFDGFDYDLSGWSVTAGTWSASSGVLESPDSSDTNEYIYYSGKTFENITVEADINIVSSAYTNKELGFYFNQLDSSFGDAEGVFNIRVDNGDVYCSGSTATPTFTPTLNTWYHIKAVVNGPTARFYVDGELQCEATGTRDSGYIGFRSISSLTRVDNLRISPSEWHYRVPVELQAGSSGRNATPVHTRINFDAYLSTMNAVSSFDPNSVRVINETGEELASVVQFNETGPVAQYRFSEGVGATTADGSGNGLTGTIYTATWDEGIHGNALYFAGTNEGNTADSSDVVVVGDNAAIDVDVSTGFTIEAWFKPDSYVCTALVRKAGQFELYHCSGSGGAATIRVWDPSVQSKLGSTGLSNGEWYHLVATHDGASTLRLYVNGDLDNEWSVSGTPSSTTGDLSIGGYDTGAYSTKGWLDEVKIYNYALTPDEVRAEYAGRKASWLWNATHSADTNTTHYVYFDTIDSGAKPDAPYASFDPALLGYWDFEANDSTSAYDQSGMDNNGTITSADWVRYGKIGSAFTFDGSSDYISTGITTTPSAFTLSAWAYPDVTDGTLATLASKFSSGPYNGFFLRHVNGVMYAAVYNAGTSYSSITSVSATTWAHWAMTFDGSTIRLYKNGALADNDAGTLGSTSAAFVIGANYAGSSERFDGIIDEVYLYNRALTAEEVNALYAQTDFVRYAKTAQNYSYADTIVVDAVNDFTVSTANTGGTDFDATTSSLTYCTGDDRAVTFSCRAPGSSGYVTQTDTASPYSVTFSSGTLPCNGENDLVECFAYDPSFYTINTANTWLEAENGSTGGNPVADGSTSAGFKRLFSGGSQIVVTATTPHRETYKVWIYATQCNSGNSAGDYAVTVNSITHYANYSSSSSTLAWSDAGYWNLSSGAYGITITSASACGGNTQYVDAVLLTTNFSYTPSGITKPSSIVTFDPDDAEGYCNACSAGDKTTGGNDSGVSWNLGLGDVATTTCCGDDASEYYFENQNYTTNGLSNSPTGGACCDAATDCADANGCTATDNTRTGDAAWACYSTKWDECQSDDTQYCPNNDCSGSALFCDSSDTTWRSQSGCSSGQDAEGLCEEDCITGAASAVCDEVTLGGVGSDTTYCCSACASPDSTITDIGAWSNCEYSSHTGSADYCLDDDTDSCYAASGDSCASGTGWGLTGSTGNCPDIGTVSGTTCYYHSTGSRADDCSASGCQVQSCSLGFGETCHGVPPSGETDGCFVDASACEAACRAEGYGTGYVSSSTCYCVPAEATLVSGAVVADPNLAAAYTFDEAQGSVLHDLSGNGNDGTITGASWVGGYNGSALKFDGASNNIAVSAVSSIADVFDAGGTISAWIYPESAGGGSLGRLWDKSQHLAHVVVSGSNARIQFNQAFSGGTNAWYTTAYAVPLDQWSHITLVYDSDSVSNSPAIYIDGVSESLTQSSSTTGTRTSDSANAFNLGNNAGGIRGFDGRIDNLAIYNRTLSATEITDLYTNGFTAHGEPSDTFNLSAILKTTAPQADAGAFSSYYYDDFSDGDYTNTPTWSVTAGSATWAVSNGQLSGTGNSQDDDLTFKDFGTHVNYTYEVFVENDVTSTGIISNGRYIRRLSATTYQLVGGGSYTAAFGNNWKVIENGTFLTFYADGELIFQEPVSAGTGQFGVKLDEPTSTNYFDNVTLAIFDTDSNNQRVSHEVGTETFLSGNTSYTYWTADQTGKPQSNETRYLASWQNTSYPYRIPVHVTTTTSSTDPVINARINFNRYLAQANLSHKQVDPYSVRVYDPETGFVATKHDLAVGQEFITVGGRTAGQIHYANFSASAVFSTLTQIIDFTNEVNGVAIADFTGDGLFDIIAPEEGTPDDIYLFVQTSAGTFVQVLIDDLSGLTDNGDIVAGDFNNDGLMDFFYNNADASTDYLYLNNGDRTFARSTVTTAGTRSADAADFDGDGNLDIIVHASTGASNAQIVYGNGDGTFGGAVAVSDGCSGDAYCSATGDFDEDGDIDYICNNGGTGNIIFNYGDGAGDFSSSTTLFTVSEHTGCDTYDFDRDGHLDLVTMGWTSGDIKYYAGNGDGTFASATIIDDTTLSNGVMAIATPRQNPLATVSWEWTGSHNANANKTFYVYFSTRDQPNISYAPATVWDVEYEANVLPTSDGWSKSGTQSEAIVDSKLNTTDASASDRIYYTRSISGDNGVGTTLEARLKIQQTSGDDEAVILIIRDDAQSFYLQLFEDHISFYDDTSLNYYFNTTDAFHTYRMTALGTTVNVYIDGVLRINDTLNAASSAQTIYFGLDGAGSADPTAEVIWDYVRYSLAGANPAFITVPGALQNLAYTDNPLVDDITTSTFVIVDVEGNTTQIEPVFNITYESGLSRAAQVVCAVDDATPIDQSATESCAFEDTVGENKTCVITSLSSVLSEGVSNTMYCDALDPDYARIAYDETVLSQSFTPDCSSASQWKVAGVNAYATSTVYVNASTNQICFCGSITNNGDLDLLQTSSDGGTFQLYGPTDGSPTYLSSGATFSASQLLPSVLDDGDSYNLNNEACAADPSTFCITLSDESTGPYNTQLDPRYDFENDASYNDRCTDHNTGTVCIDHFIESSATATNASGSGTDDVIVDVDYAFAHSASCLADNIDYNCTIYNETDKALVLGATDWTSDQSLSGTVDDVSITNNRQNMCPGYYVECSVRSTTYNNINTTYSASGVFDDTGASCLTGADCCSNLCVEGTCQSSCDGSELQACSDDSSNWDTLALKACYDRDGSGTDCYALPSLRSAARHVYLDNTAGNGFEMRVFAKDANNYAGSDNLTVTLYKPNGTELSTEEYTSYTDTACNPSLSTGCFADDGDATASNSVSASNTHSLTIPDSETAGVWKAVFTPDSADVRLYYIANVSFIEMDGATTTNNVCVSNSTLASEIFQSGRYYFEVPSDTTSFDLQAGISCCLASNTWTVRNATDDVVGVFTNETDATPTSLIIAVQSNGTGIWSVEPSSQNRQYYGLGGLATDIVPGFSWANTTYPTVGFCVVNGTVDTPTETCTSNYQCSDVDSARSCVNGVDGNKCRLDLGEACQNNEGYQCATSYCNDNCCSSACVESQADGQTCYFAQTCDASGSCLQGSGDTTIQVDGNADLTCTTCAEDSAGYEYSDTNDLCYFATDCGASGWSGTANAACYQAGELSLSDATLTCYYNTTSVCDASGCNTLTDTQNCDYTSLSNTTGTSRAGAGYCLDDTANNCYYSASNVCAEDNDGFDWSSAACADPGSTAGSTCYYHATSDRSDDCTTAGCQITTCTLAEGEVCHPTNGCQVSVTQCVAYCQSLNFSSGYERSGSCLCTPADGVLSTYAAVSPTNGTATDTYTYSAVFNTTSNENATANLWIDDSSHDSSAGIDGATLSVTKNGLACSLSHDYYFVSDKLVSNADTFAKGWGESFAVITDWTTSLGNLVQTDEYVTLNVTSGQTAVTSYEGIEDISSTTYPYFALRYKNTQGSIQSIVLKNSAGVTQTTLYPPQNTSWNVWQTTLASSLSIDQAEITINESVSHTTDIDWIRIHDGSNTLADWWNTTWHYRVPVTLSHTSATSSNTVQATINLTKMLENAQVTDTIDQDSIRVISAAGSAVNHESGWSDGSLMLEFVWSGSQSANSTQTYYVYFDTTNFGTKSSTSTSLTPEVNATTLVGALQNYTTANGPIVDDIASLSIALNSTASTSSGVNVSFTGNYCTTDTRDVNVTCFLYDGSSLQTSVNATATHAAGSAGGSAVVNISALCGGSGNYFACQSLDPAYTNIFNNTFTNTSAFDPDSAENYCDACTYTWDALFSSNNCCGDDSGGAGDIAARITESAQNNDNINPDTCTYCDGTYGSSSCFNDLDNCAASGTIRKPSAPDTTCTSGADCSCYYGESCANGAYTAPTSTALQTCDAGGYIDNAGANCQVGNTCYHLGSGSDPCDGTGVSVYTDLTLDDATQVDDTTCTTCDQGYQYNDNTFLCYYGVSCEMNDTIDGGWQFTNSVACGKAGNVTVSDEGSYYNASCFYFDVGQSAECDASGCQSANETIGC